MLPEPPDIILLREDMDPNKGRLEDIRRKCNKSLVISGRDVKFIIDCYESAIFWKNMAYFGIIFMATIIITMSFK